MNTPITCLSFLSLIIIGTLADMRKSYSGDKVIKIPVTDEDVFHSVSSMIEHLVPAKDRDYWQEPAVGGAAIVHLSQQHYKSVENELRRRHLEYDVIIHDMEQFIQLQHEKKRSRKSDNDRPEKFLDIVGTFARYGEIITWIDDIVAEYPEIATAFSIGNTYEGRQTRLLKLGVPRPGQSKWSVWLEAGMHAREWLAPATVIYMTEQLIQGYVNNDTEIVEFLETLDFHIIPIANPDGYEYTHTMDRLWRKNRRLNNGSSCVGVDLNRNFGFQWGGVGASADPCSNTYMGPGQNSEIEVQNIVNYMLPMADEFILYQAYHTWGQQFFTRWDYTATSPPPDHAELLDLAQRAAAAITNVHGTFFEAGIAPELMYAFSGSSSDWARGVANIKYPFLLEIRDNGDYGFVPPEGEIIPSGEENWEGFKVVLREVVNRYGAVSPPVRK